MTRYTSSRTFCFDSLHFPTLNYGLYSDGEIWDELNSYIQQGTDKPAALRYLQDLATSALDVKDPGPLAPQASNFDKGSDLVGVPEQGVPPVTSSFLNAMVIYFKMSWSMPNIAI